MCADSSFASKLEDRKSVLGNATLDGGRAVIWLSRTQRCVMLSSTETEYVAIGEYVKQVLLLGEILGLAQPTTEVTGLPVGEDNQRSIKLKENSSSSARSRHNDVPHH